VGTQIVHEVASEISDVAANAAITDRSDLNQYSRSTVQIHPAKASTSGLRRCFSLAAFADPGVAAAALAFRAAAHRFLCAAAMRRRVAGRAMRLGASSRANGTVLSKPGGPVISTRTAPREGVRDDPAFIWTSDVLRGGFHGHLDAMPSGGGDSLAVENGQGHGTGADNAGGR
jgi:hypothetical protein